MSILALVLIFASFIWGSIKDTFIYSPNSPGESLNWLYLLFNIRVWIYGALSLVLYTAGNVIKKRIEKDVLSGYSIRYSTAILGTIAGFIMFGVINDASNEVIKTLSHTKTNHQVPQQAIQVEENHKYYNEYDNNVLTADFESHLAFLIEIMDEWMLMEEDKTISLNDRYLYVNNFLIFVEDSIYNSEIDFSGYERLEEEYDLILNTLIEFCYAYLNYDLHGDLEFYNEAYDNFNLALSYLYDMIERMERDPNTELNLGV
ncbi:hypothetical protein M3202_18475 [Alkalihalobacillus oceani]|uniref:Uncharacterized protein n=1 Tax=Halalkalibacter oceani TaxID=1653776 RepID=A0A9X2DST2_9BACI|nr:hypothetical protein [Halalkalibacter oceani]MCM3716041.1 hypothetical protein [Halalkalibacter oceani]